MEPQLYLGNLDAKRDWGHAKDYVEAQWLILQQDQPDDYVIATGVQYSVREFVEAAANELGITIEWQGAGVDEIGIVASVTGEDAPAVQAGNRIVQIDPRYFRPTEVETLLGIPHGPSSNSAGNPKSVSRKWWRNGPRRPGGGSPARGLEGPWL